MAMASVLVNILAHGLQVTRLDNQTSADTDTEPLASSPSPSCSCTPCPRPAPATSATWPPAPPPGWARSAPPSPSSSPPSSPQSAGAPQYCLNLSILTCHNISTCGRRKSTRLVAVAGGLVTALGCLFTSFASQWHQVFIRQNISRAVSQNFTSPARDNPIIISQPIVMNRFSKLLMILLSYPYLLNGQYYLVVK